MTAVAVAGPSMAAPTPRLHGDGIHDDTNALEALFRGARVDVAGERFTAQNSDGTVRLFNAKFKTTRPVRVEAGVNLYAANCTFIMNDGPAVPYPILKTVARN
jgi:hypothetical protein